MRTDFKVYKRKIHVFRETNALDGDTQKWRYVWSTNAFKTCKDAKEDAEIQHPTVKFKASFAKD